MCFGLFDFQFRALNESGTDASTQGNSLTKEAGVSQPFAHMCCGPCLTRQEAKLFDLYETALRAQMREQYDEALGMYQQIIEHPWKDQAEVLL